jgi:hypothetical protein
MALRESSKRKVLLAWRDINMRGRLEDRRDYTIEDLALAHFLSHGEAEELYNMIQDSFKPSS